MGLSFSCKKQRTLAIREDSAVTAGVARGLTENPYPVVRPHVPTFALESSEQVWRIKYQKSLKQQAGPHFISALRLLFCSV